MGIEHNIIQGANGILNGKVLRFKNEPVRHKTLDLIGDLALLGVPIKGHVTAARAGHASNVEFVKKLKTKCIQYKIEYVPVDINEGFEQVLTSYLINRNSFK